MIKTKQHIIAFFRDNLVAFFMFLLVFVIFIIGTASAKKTSAEQGKKIAEDSIYRAVVSCYAMEGFYPDDIDYLKENYGLHIDDKRFIVHYDSIASNIMPDITIIEKQG